MPSLTPADREARARDAGPGAEQLLARDVDAVALTWVDNAGVTRVKAVPTSRLAHAAAWGVGATTAFDAFLLDDSIMSGTYAGGPTGDLRLHPDLARLTVLHAQPGWAWAPVDRYRQDGEAHPQCARGLLRRVCADLAGERFSARAAFEVEWALGRDDSDGHGDGAFVAACAGPAYGMTRVIELSDYARDVLVALRTQGVEVEQFHPEYGAAQFELSVAAEDPVAAADTTVLVRQTVRAVGQRHGLRTSLSPKVLLDGVGNGGHVHLSLTGAAGPLMSGGQGPEGLSTDGTAFTAGILDRLPALLTLGAPTAASYLRLVPSHWAGAFACWGPENREASLRVVGGTESGSANLEVKCFDLTANPYLLLAGLLVAGRAGMDEAATLPPPVTVDPAGVPPEQRAALGIRTLPGDLEAAAAAFEADSALTTAFGTELATTLVEHRRAEAAATRDLTPEQIVRRCRWTH